MDFKISIDFGQIQKCSLDSIAEEHKKHESYPLRISGKFRLRTSNNEKKLPGLRNGRLRQEGLRNGRLGQEGLRNERLRQEGMLPEVGDI
ncbi:hypothetical protein GLOIN_2v1502842 [Rhizophagus irregularis DAOM 181602=DAOM 197198]|nr:hypothetical protein GLOIN_2v1502842 [Rhizophagus irregularis DAOM 181602=DAOM 197198]